jgi:hypothetical protein
MISTGVIVRIKNPFYMLYKNRKKSVNQEELFRFSFSWDIKNRSKIYIVLNNKKYLIKYKNKFKQHYDSINRIISINVLKEELSECLEGIDNNTVLEIVKNGIEEAKIVQKRGEELVSNVIGDIKCEFCSIDIQGSALNGYKINGIKGGKYFVKKDSLDVYKWKDGSWNKRCVVDMANKQRIYEDRLANRLMNIYNEFDKISTIQG